MNLGPVDRETDRRRLLDILQELADRGCRAACQSYDPAAWTDDDEAVQRVAAKLCATCPARGPCREYVRRWPGEFGVYAGRTTRDKRHLTTRT